MTMQIVIDVSEEEYASCKKHFENLGKREVINDYESMLSQTAHHYRKDMAD